MSLKISWYLQNCSMPICLFWDFVVTFIGLLVLQPRAQCLHYCNFTRSFDIFQDEFSLPVFFKCTLTIFYSLSCMQTLGSACPLPPTLFPRPAVYPLETSPLVRHSSNAFLESDCSVASSVSEILERCQSYSTQTFLY